MLFWDHTNSNLRDQSHNMILWTLGSIQEPHFLHWDWFQTLIGISHFNLLFLKISRKSQNLMKIFDKIYDFFEKEAN